MKQSIPVTTSCLYFKQQIFLEGDINTSNNRNQLLCIIIDDFVNIQQFGLIVVPMCYLNIYMLPSSSFSIRSCPWWLRGQQLKIDSPHITVCHYRQHYRQHSHFVEASSGSILDPQCSLASVFMVVPPAFSLLLSQVKLFWKVFPEAFCLHGQTV